MPIQPLESANLRVITDDTGRMVDIIDAQGDSIGVVGSRNNPLTGGLTLNGGIKTVGMRQSVLRVATFGDSTATVVTGNTDISFYDAPFPASGATVIGPDLAKYCTGHYYPQARLVACGGITGETTTQMLARDNIAGSATRRAIADVLNLYPDVVLLRAGSINNIAGITPATYAATISTCFSEHVTIINRFLAGGTTVIDEGIFGYSSAAATYPDLVRQALLELNTKFREYAASLNRFDLQFINTGLCDATGSYLPNMSGDGVHLSINGEMTLAKNEARVLTALFGESKGSQFKGVNLLLNPLFSASSVLAAGTVATGYVCTGTNATVANGKIEDIDGAIYQTYEITPTASAALGSIAIPFNPTTFGIVANDLLGFEVNVIVQALDGSSPPIPTEFYVRNDIYKTAAGRVIASEFTGTYSALDKQIKSRMGLLYRCQEASAALSVSSAAYFTYKTDEIKAFKIGISAPRLVRNPI